MAALDFQAALERRDFAAAHTILRHLGLSRHEEQQWRAYLLFHGGDMERAADVYCTLAASSRGKPFELHLACCMFQMGRYQEARAAAQKGPESALKTRLLLHCGAKLQASDAQGAAAGQEAGMGEQVLAGGKLDDQLSWAALLYARNEYEGAAAVYQRLLEQYPDLHALHIYLALCFFMLDDWQRSSTHVAAYQAEHPDSVQAVNIRACNEFRAGGAQAALDSMGSLPQQLPQGSRHGALIRHNAVVFSDGQGGMQVLPPLVDSIPEARLNLVLFYCRRGDPGRALHLMRGLEPATALEHICKAVACALHGQAARSPEHIQQACEHFTAVGTAGTELDSVPGRQCMASALLLGPQPDKALPCLESVAEVCQGDDALSWNLGMSRAAAGQWAEAAEALQQVARQDLQQDPSYQSWLARCLVRAGQPADAWQVYLQAQQRLGAVPPVAELLQLLANDCFLAGWFLWAARAFHALEYMQQQLQQQGAGVLGAALAPGGVWEGKRAACVEAFREVVQGKLQASEVLPELLGMLRGSSNPQAHVVATAIRQWAREHAPQAVPEAAS